MKRFASLVLGAVVMSILLAGAYISALPGDEISLPDKLDDILPTPQQTPVEKQEPISIDHLQLVDDISVYDNPQGGEVVTAYITVRRGNISDNTDHSWLEVDNASKAVYEISEFENVPKAEVIFQIGNEVGPLPGQFGFGELRTNGTIQVRGNTSSKKSLKSYKVELRNWTGGWNDQFTLALNKHVGDITRIKNKLCYDLLIGQPDTISLRTQFFHIYLKDETNQDSEISNTAFEDLGLFTMVEQPNTTFLRNHGLDPNAQLYKANFFEFFRSPDKLKTVDDPSFDLSQFEDILEVKGDKNHTKLLEMLDAVNDPRIPITDTFEYYFDADNYFSWMAFNILVGNIDTSSQNFYLYSPQSSHKWFFIPWDFDGSFDRLNLAEFGYNPTQDWQEGVQTYWGVVLHKRVLSEPKYRELLDEKIEYWMAELTPNKINGLLTTYRPLTEPLLTVLPDEKFFNQAEYDFAYQTFSAEIDNNYMLYQKSLEEPMPFFVFPPILNSGSVEFGWNSSYDFQDTDISYNIQVARDLEFSDMIIDEKIKNFTTLKVENDLPVGAYFLRISAEDPNGHKQFSYGRYIDPDRVVHIGLRLFYVQKNETGKVIRLINE